MKYRVELIKQITYVVEIEAENEEDLVDAVDRSDAWDLINENGDVAYDWEIIG